MPSLLDTNPVFLARERFESLLDAIRQAGYQTIGPKVRDGAIIYSEIESSNDFPIGVRDEQEAGHYRLRQDGQQWFAWANGPQALKPLLFSPQESLWRSTRDASGVMRFESPPPAEPKPLAVIGVRACDIAALRIQDQHFTQGAIRDPFYAKRRNELLLVAIHCSHPSGTCFCGSTGDGPAVEGDCDLALTELEDGFLLRCGTEKGGGFCVALDCPDATTEQLHEEKKILQNAREKQKRSLPSQNLRQALLDKLDSPHWDAVAERCFSCGNCTSVCPTCFCHTERDIPALDGSHSDHARQWSSCFTQEHSYIHGMTIRASTAFRYRQWLTHKLATWHDQFGRSGCVGCGRCISWCPAAIDITAEVHSLLEPVHE